MLMTPRPQVATFTSMEQRRLQIYALMLVADLLALGGAFVLAGGLYRSEWPSDFALSMFFAFAPIFTAIVVYQRCYSRKALEELRFAIGRLGLAIVVAAVLCMVMIFYAKASESFSRVMLSLALVIGFSLMVLLRALLHFVLRRVYGPKISSALIVLDGGPSLDIPGATTVTVGDFDVGNAQSCPVSLDEIGRLMRGMDRVIVSCPAERRLQWAHILRAAGVRGDVLSEPLKELGALALKREGDQLFLVVSTGPLPLHARIIKRVIDIAFASAALIVLSPLLLLVALLIKLEDGGPVLFVQQRMGQGNIMFPMFKFRSMRVEMLDTKGERSTSREDSRVTKVGKFIRRTSIDELPQLLNVLRAEMSIVGPRPHALGSLANEKLFWEIDGNYWQRHSLKPGLTGLAQVRGHRGATESENHLTHRLEADLEYIRNWSLLQDFKIMVATARVLLHPNAY